MRRLDRDFDARQSLLDCLEMLLHGKDPFSERHAAQHPGMTPEAARERFIQAQRRACSFLDGPLGITRD